MMRPQLRILSAFLALTLLMGVAAHGQTLLPLLVDASGNFQEVETSMEPSEEPGVEMPSTEVTPADEEGVEEQSPEDEEKYLAHA